MFNHKEEGYIDKIKGVTPNGAGVDIVLEMLANVNLQQDLDVIKQWGTIVVIGNRGDTTINAR